MNRVRALPVPLSVLVLLPACKRTLHSKDLLVHTLIPSQIAPSSASSLPMPFLPCSTQLFGDPFLQLWLYKRYCASFSWFFCESCSTCRYIFNLFVEGGELHVLLLCHLGPPPSSISPKCICVFHIFVC